MKIIILNDEIYVVKNFDLKIINTKLSLLPTPHDKLYDEKWTEFCDSIRKKYKPKYTASLMFRDD